MSRRPATVTQADVARIVRAAKQAGAAEVELRMGGNVSILVRMASSTGSEMALEPDEKIVL